MSHLSPQASDRLATKADVDAVGHHVNELEARFDGLETRIDRLEARFDRLENQFRELGTEVRRCTA